MGFSLTSLLGGSIGEVFSKIVGAFKLSPEKKAEFEAAIKMHEFELASKQAELESKLADFQAREIEAAASIIKAEAESQSWLPRNVRPLLLLMWGTLITVNFLIPLLSKFTGVDIPPVVLDSWVYKLTAIGFTGYVGFRSWEKVKDADK